MGNAPSSSDDPFHTTHWSVVLNAGGSDATGREALAALCAAYWHPLYAYARRRLASTEDAQDVTQAFFAELIEKKVVDAATPERGRFRAFLLTAFKHFLSKYWQRGRALKRGGGRRQLSLDFESAERRIESELQRGPTPDEIFERRWACTVLDRVLEQLATEHELRVPERTQQVPFDALRSFLLGEASGETYASVADRYGTSAAALKMSVHRLRSRFRQRLRAEISQTVSSPEQIDDEIRSLMQILEK